MSFFTMYKIQLTLKFQEAIEKIREGNAKFY